MFTRGGKGAAAVRSPCASQTTRHSWPGNMPDETHKKVLVLGLGNDILSDDAVGLLVARAVRDRLEGGESIAVVESVEMGLALLDFVVGYRDLIVVDAILTGQAKPGSVHEVAPGQLQVLPKASPHFVGVGETLALGRTLGMAMPERVTILAVEVADPFTMGTQMSPSLRTALPEVVDRVLAKARSLAAE